MNKFIDPNKNVVITKSLLFKLKKDDYLKLLDQDEYYKIYNEKLEKIRKEFGKIENKLTDKSK